MTLKPPNKFSNLPKDNKAKFEIQDLFGLPKTHIILAIKIAFWFLFVCAIFLVFVKIFHLTTPWIFLNEVQLKQVDSILFSSAISSMATLLGKKFFFNQKK